MATANDRIVVDEAVWNDSIQTFLEDQPPVGLALGVVRREGLERFYGHGVADIVSGRPVTAKTVFRIASITKTFTAIAIMQLHERGEVELDAPASEYLRSYRLVAVDPDHAPATVRHLLTHTAGLGEMAYVSGFLRPDFGESFSADDPMPSLPDFYRGELHLRAEPGIRFVYNNHGPATLGQLIEDITGESLADYFRANLFEPLGMAATCLGRSEAIAADLATGYEFRRGKPQAVVDRNMVTAGAAGIYSTPGDMARYVAALLGGEAGRMGSILSAESLQSMFAPHYLPDPRIPGMGLGFFRYDVGGQLAVGHQGSHPGFHSQLTLVPDCGVGVMAFTNGAAQADLRLPSAVAQLLRPLIGVDSDSVARRVPSRPELWADLCGWYQLQASPSDVRLRGMMGLGTEVFIRDGRLMLRFLSLIPELFRGFPLIPDDADDPYSFRIDIFGSGRDFMRVVFSGKGHRNPSQMCLDIMPLVLEKRPEHLNPRKWAAGAVAIGGAASLAAYLGRRQ